MKLHRCTSTLFLGLCLLFLGPSHAKPPRIRIKGVKGQGPKTSPKTTSIFKTKPATMTTPECASISIFRHKHLEAMNFTTTTTEWPEVSRIKKRIADNHPRDSIIIDVLRTKFNLMTDKQKFKVEFGRFKKYVLKIGGNGTRFLPQFLEIADKNHMFESRVAQIDQFLKRWGLPRYTHINQRFTYITPVYTPPLNYTPTEKYSKIMWFKTSVLDVRYQNFLKKKNNPIIWDDLNIQTTDAWMAAVQNMPGYRHHMKRVKISIKRQREYNRTRLRYMKLAEMRRLNLTGEPGQFNGTLWPTVPTFMAFEQPDVMGPINRYFNQTNFDGSDDPWHRFFE